MLEQEFMKIWRTKGHPFLHPRSEALNIERIELFMAMNEDA